LNSYQLHHNNKIREARKFTRHRRAGKLGSEEPEVGTTEPLNHGTTEPQSLSKGKSQGSKDRRDDNHENTRVRKHGKDVSRPLA